VTTAPKIELMCHVMRVLCIKRIRTRNYANSAKNAALEVSETKAQDSEFGEPCNQNFYKRNSLIHKDEKYVECLEVCTCSGNDQCYLILASRNETWADLNAIWPENCCSIATAGRPLILAETLVELASQTACRGVFVCPRRPRL